MLGMLYISALMKLQFPSSICTTTFYISFGKITINFYLLLLASSTTHLTYLTKYVGHNVWQEIPFRKQDHKATSRYVLHGTVALLDTGYPIRKICIFKMKQNQHFQKVMAICSQNFVQDSILVKNTGHWYVKFSIFWFVVPTFCLHTYHPDLWGGYIRMQVKTYFLESS